MCVSGDRAGEVGLTKPFGAQKMIGVQDLKTLSYSHWILVCFDLILTVP